MNVWMELGKLTAGHGGTAGDGIQWKYRARLPFSEREKPGDIGLGQRLSHYSMKIWTIFIKEE